MCEEKLHLKLILIKTTATDSWIWTSCRCDILVSVCSHQVEEGWWSGNINGKSGLFPSNFVKELDATGDEPESNCTAADEAGKSC